MTAPRIPAEDHTSTGPPVACSLSRAGRAGQAGRWARLAARSLTGRIATADGVLLRFRAEPGAEAELRTLVAVETQCCPWATWTIQTGPAQLVLDVRSAGDGIAALHSMFTTQRQARSHGRPRRPAASAPGDAGL